MDPYLISTVKKNTPEFNRTITNGLAVEHMMGRTEGNEFNNTIAYINQLFMINQSLFPEGFTFAGVGLCSPIEQFEKVTREYNSRRRANIARDSTYMVSLNFEYQGQQLRPAHILLPYVVDGGLLHINGAMYNIAPVITDIGYSVIQGSIFIPFKRTRLTFNNLDYHYYVDDRREVGMLIWSMIHLKMKEVGKRDVRQRKVIMSSLAHYFFAQFGVQETFTHWGKCPLEVGLSHTFTEESHPSAKYMRFTSIKHRGRHPVGELVLVIPRECDSDFIRLLVTGFFYVMDTFPDRFVDTEQVLSAELWQNLLGRLIYGDFRFLGKVKQDVEDHLESFSKQLDAMTRAELKERDVDVADSWELLYCIMTQLSHHFYQRSDDEASMYGKRLTILRYLLEQLNHAISTFSFQFQSLKKKKEEEGGWTVDDLEKQIRNTFKLKIAISELTKSHGEIAIVAYPGDNKFLKTTSMLIPQDKARKTKGYTKGVFNDPTRQLDPSIAEVAQFNNQPKNMPDGRGRINPYVYIDTQGTVKRKEHLREIIDNARLYLRR